MKRLILDIPHYVLNAIGMDVVTHPFILEERARASQGWITDQMVGDLRPKCPVRPVLEEQHKWMGETTTKGPIQSGCLMGHNRALGVVDYPQRARFWG